MGVLSGLKPEKVFQYFEEICNIPHGSYNIDQISDYLVEFAKVRNLSYVQDELKNVFISKEATPGYEEAEGIVIQGHMDMVAVKKPESTIDMKTEGLKLAIDGDFVYAQDTSLGGDDGIAVAYALAILDDDTLPHPHLDVLITVNEEVGMDGAFGADLSGIKGTRFLNLDSEAEGTFWVGCAGGIKVNHSLPVKKEEVTGEVISYKLSGLQGGHSGAEIHTERGNAIILQGRLLKALSDVSDIRIISMDGGLADNAIPREVDVKLVALPKQGAAVADVKASIEDMLGKAEMVLKNELATKDPGVFISCKSEGVQTVAATDTASTKKVTQLLLALPNGVQSMSADMEGLVQTSLNYGIMHLTDALELQAALRSSVSTEKAALLEKVTAIADLAGAKTEAGGRYPGWEYKVVSPFRDLCVKVYKELYGKEPAVQAIHAGLECGLFMKKRPDFDCISMGPDMQSIHTTEEKLSISSTKRVWEFLCKLMEEAK